MGNLNLKAETFLAEMFEYEYCSECGGDAQHHDAVPFLGNWFARCMYERNEDGELHPAIQAFRKAEQKKDS